MMLDAVVRNPDALIEMERYVDGGAKSYSGLAARTDVAPCYRPESDVPSFDLVALSSPEDRVVLFEGDPTPSLVGHFVREQGILLPVHPETYADRSLEGSEVLQTLPHEAPIRVAPTASTRTVFVLDSTGGVPRHFLKLHYPVRISRFNRRLRTKNIRNSVAVSLELADIRAERFAYLPDVLGATFGSGEEAWGFLAREASPRPFVEGRFLIPGFALFAKDLRRPDDPPLLAQMIERLGVEPSSFTVEEIFIPIVECWCAAARNHGILLESHAQNTLLEIDGEFRPRRIVHRDFDVWIDGEARRRLGVDAQGAISEIAPDTGPSIEQRYSLVYDRFIGHGFFDYLLDLLKRRYGVDEERIVSRVRRAFHDDFPDADRLFPADTMFYFAENPPSGREFALEDLRRPPVWR
jgi:siderophore synthetase component